MFHQSDSPHVIDGQRVDTGDAGEEIADLLADPHCRYLLTYLDEEEDPASVAAATRYVVAQITDAPPEDVSEDVVRRVQTWFHHGQLPTLDAYGIVDFDPDAGTVSLTDETAD